jgi:CheY-like chemotaxis protein
LANVRLRLQPSGRYTTSDAAGVFFFDNLRESEYSIVGKSRSGPGNNGRTPDPAEERGVGWRKYFRHWEGRSGHPAGDPPPPHWTGPSPEQHAVPLILVVEDDPVSRKLLVAIFSRQYRTEEAVNGREGLDKALALRPDLIVSDIQMPCLSGVLMVEELRRHPGFEATPVILVSASASDEIQFGALRTQIGDFISKPFEPRELLARTSRLLAERRRSEASIHQAYTLLRTVLDGVADSIFVKDLEGRYLMLNAAAAQRLGASVDSILGRDDSAFVSPRAAQKVKEAESAILNDRVARTSE